MRSLAQVAELSVGEIALYRNRGHDRRYHKHEVSWPAGLGRHHLIIDPDLGGVEIARGQPNRVG